MDELTKLLARDLRIHDRSDQRLKLCGRRRAPISRMAEWARYLAAKPLFGALSRSDNPISVGSPHVTRSLDRSARLGAGACKGVKFSACKGMAAHSFD